MTTGDYHTLERPPEGDAPLVFAFHGTGGDERQFDDLIRQMLPGAGIVAPRGDVSEHGAARFFRRTGEGVYDMDDLARATAKMTAFVKAKRAAAGPRPVYGLGYSNGANILASVLFAAPELFDRAVLMHPLIPFTPPAQPGLAGKTVLITAGRRDPICPLPLTVRLVDYFTTQGGDVHRSLHPGGHEVTQDEIAAVAGVLQAG